MFGYPVVISIDFANLIYSFSPSVLMSCLRFDIKHSLKCFVRIRNSFKFRPKKLRYASVFLALFLFLFFFFLLFFFVLHISTRFAVLDNPKGTRCLLFDLKSMKNYFAFPSGRQTWCPQQTFWQAKQQTSIQPKTIGGVNGRPGWLYHVLHQVNMANDHSSPTHNDWIPNIRFQQRLSQNGGISKRDAHGKRRGKSRSLPLAWFGGRRRESHLPWPGYLYRKVVKQHLAAILSLFGDWIRLDWRGNQSKRLAIYAAFYFPWSWRHSYTIWSVQVSFLLKLAEC